MKKNSGKGSRLFLIEFLIVLFFFLIISTVCLQLFVKAHLITRRSEALSHAQAAAASVAALIESGNDTPEKAASYFPEASIESDGFYITYDSDFRTCTPEKAAYTLKVLMTENGQEVLSDITVTEKDHSVLYELSVSFHRPFTRKEALQ